jgi:NAD(P)-dependent dehydrogenase (short-subunit alcohol dehydrogenase family)
MSRMLLAGLLEGVKIAVAGAAEVLEECRTLGAEIAPLGPADDEMAVEPVPDVLVCATGSDLDSAFISTRAVANAWIGAERGGKVVLVAPRDDAPTSAALENLARTLSIEWARYGITPTAILPGAATSDDEVAQLIAFLASPAGDYYSGCAFTLR